jgi:hypothetical protein
MNLTIKTVDPYDKPHNFFVASTAHTKEIARFVPSGPRSPVYIGLYSYGRVYGFWLKKQGYGIKSTDDEGETYGRRKN